MSNRLLDLYLRYRVALPLASFLIYLNTVKIVLGGIELKSILCGLSFFALIEISYAYDARFRNREDVINLPEGRVVAYKVWHLLAAAAVPVVYLVSAGFLPLLIYAAAAIFIYSDPHLFPRPFKTIPGFKMLVNMLNFWIVGMLAPMLFKHELSPGLVFSVLRFSGPFLVLLFCLNVLVDIRDTKGDREAGIWTLPAVIGVPASAWLLVIMLTAAGAAAFARGDGGGAVFALGLAVFSFLALKPRSRLFYEWVLAFTDAYLAAALAYRLL